MQKNIVIALAILGTLTAGYFLLKSKPATTAVDTDTTSLREIYNQWKNTYRAHIGALSSDVEDYRFKVFSDNYAKIIKHNSLNKSYKLGLNAFAHLTQEEFAATRLGLKLPKNRQRNFAAFNLPTDNLKTKVDWRSKMNGIKDQGQCASCWAFSVTGAVEGLHSIFNDNLMNLSEQELVDCSQRYGNEGCNGGIPDYTFPYVRDQKGIALQNDYRYMATDGFCRASGLSRNGPISGFVDIPVNKSAPLKAAIAQQPVSVGIESHSYTFQLYSSGIINDDSCGIDLDHAVVAVGYDETSNPPYYLVRNSWGTSWGEKGFVRIGIRDGEGICGIQMWTSYPTL